MEVRELEKPVIPWSRYRSMGYPLEKMGEEVVVEVRELERPEVGVGLGRYDAGCSLNRHQV